MNDPAENGDETLKKLESACKELEEAFKARSSSCAPGLFDHEVKNLLFEIAALIRVLEIGRSLSPETLRLTRALKALVMGLDRLSRSMPDPSRGAK